ncbi:AmmeMemoRadiSam system protein A [Candidatus Woesearchaeota archaeon]|nr:AmmeMemoRadiSam system protein A [Candidatus Woesearchaeota archaeon]
MNDADKDYLLKLARNTLDKYILTGDTYAPDDVPDSLKQKSGTFVTLTVAGDLRGCIGSLTPGEPIFKSVINNTVNAAVDDPRFPPVDATELKRIKIEVSVLTPMKRLDHSGPDDLLARLRPDIDGVWLQLRGHGATYLPDVWEHFSDKKGFLESLCQKAGLPPDAWKDPEAKIFIYQTIKFGE